jgi:hypothetical protein
MNWGANLVVPTHSIDADKEGGEVLSERVGARDQRVRPAAISVRLPRRPGVGSRAVLDATVYPPLEREWSPDEGRQRSSCLKYRIPRGEPGVEHHSEHYIPAWGGEDLNLRPTDYESAALTH